MRALVLLALVELFAMGLWFGVSAVAPQIAAEWHLDPSTAAWLTLAVQLGFVAGTLLSALLNLPDIIRTRHVLAVSALCAAIVNAVLAIFVHSAAPAIALRFLTGVFLAGVYPPGMKLIATWFRQGRGLALGVLVGALTLGKASPYLVNAVGSKEWRINAGFASVMAIVAVVLVVFFVREGPYALPNQPFDIGQIAKGFRNRGVRLANFGYFGHMWELYAMWTWAPVMIRASLKVSGDKPIYAEIASFVVIGAGAIGCVVAGRVADRIGRPIVASAAMIASGACCIAIGFFYGHSPVALLVIAAIWGATVVADSAQFSACVTELGDPRYVGTALTIQTCIGFLITTVSIRMMPALVARAGWQYAFAALAIGPFLGTMAMLRLRGATVAAYTSPASAKSG
ncbi:MAG TPA: MFS transporter [Thermoanaerobaculia bacterium]|nr:MFS transporter [Thermoanaerobaculia bacterium]